jgi:hypothetical protein
LFGGIEVVSNCVLGRGEKSIRAFRGEAVYRNVIAAELLRRGEGAETQLKCFTDATMSRENAT